MSGATIFVMYTNGAGNVTISARDGGGGHVEPTEDSTIQAGVTLLAGSGVIGSQMIANVKCKITPQHKFADLQVQVRHASSIHLLLPPLLHGLQHGILDLLSTVPPSLITSLNTIRIIIANSISISRKLQYPKMQTHSSHRLLAPLVLPEQLLDHQRHQHQVPTVDRVPATVEITQVEQRL